MTAKPDLQAGGRATWREHATGRISRIQAKKGPRRDLRQIKKRCSLRAISFAPGQQRVKQDRYFEFGPRWKSLKEICFEAGEALAPLELPEEYSEDLKQYVVHPALLDMATGAAFMLIPDYELSDDMCLPVSYKRLGVWSSLPRRVYSQIRLKRTESKIAVFDLTIMDEKGAPVVEIEESPMDLLSRQEARTVGGTEPMEAPTSRNGSGSSYVPPRNDIERKLTEWLEELLGIDRVGIHDDFFELGGQLALGCPSRCQSQENVG